MEKVKEKVDLGLKTTSKSIVKMTIQSHFDVRAIFMKLINVFNKRDGMEGPTIPKIYVSGFVQNFLKCFHEAKEVMFATLPSAIQDKASSNSEKILKMPKLSTVLMFQSENLFAFIKK